ncbi:MAG TPA: hypothetical protein VEJ84_13200 [Acidimicrobiales bacterium]|nr:hypothetical protein [Acidimicrobiales bacterium]
MTTTKSPTHPKLITAVVALSIAVVLCVRNFWVFSLPIREDGDYAANSILVNQAVHFHLLVGNYSREGFNHPGPAFLYFQAFGQDIFYTFLHLVPAPYNGQLIAVFLLNSAVLALTVLVFARHVRSWPVAVLAVTSIVLFTGSTLSWTSSWMPYLYAAPFLLATVSGVSVALGTLRDLPIFTFAVALLVHGHVAFIGIMGIYVLVVGLAWLVRHRPKSNYRRQLSGARGPLVASGVILSLFALPIALELVLHWPGEFGLYLHYLSSNGRKHPHSFAQVTSYVERFWPGGSTGTVLLTGVGLGTAVLAFRDADRHRRAFVIALLATVVVMTVELWWYVYKGVDYLNVSPKGYEGYFYYSVPALIVAALIVEACGYFEPAFSGPAHWRLSRDLPWAPALLSCVLAVAVISSQTSAYNRYRGDPVLSRVAAGLYRSELRKGRTVAISLGMPGAPTSDWIDVVGLLVAASREGYQPCVANAAWKYMVTGEYICPTTDPKNRWLVTVKWSGAPIPSRDVPVVSTGDVEVYSRALAPPIEIDPKPVHPWHRLVPEPY